MPEVIRKQTNQTETRVIFSAAEVHAILTWAASNTGRAREYWNSSRWGHEREGMTFKLNIEQVTAGSPAYSLRQWSATVDITEDHTRAMAMPAEEPS